jgi:hypothetical protein
MSCNSFDIRKKSNYSSVAQNPREHFLGHFARGGAKKSLRVRVKAFNKKNCMATLPDPPKLIWSSEPFGSSFFLHNGLLIDKKLLFLQLKLQLLFSFCKKNDFL